MIKKTNEWIDEINVKKKGRLSDESRSHLVEINVKGHVDVDNH